MKLAVMQPYFFPYIGYFQLIRSVDCFVILDDANYIKRGWINRNRILLDNEAHLVTVPLHRASQNQRICDIRVLEQGKWKKNLLCTLQSAYGKAPYFERIFPWVESLIQEKHELIRDLALHSIHAVCDYLGITTEIRPTSRIYGNAALKGCSRILDICERENASAYLNPPGGAALYSHEPFAQKNIALQFIRPHLIAYPQRYSQHPFVPGLSILDALMFNDKPSLAQLLGAYDTIPASLYGQNRFDIQAK